MFKLGTKNQEVGPALDFEDLTALSLEDLIAKANSYGGLDMGNWLRSDSAGRPKWEVRISFDCFRGTSLAAKSEPRYKITDALIQAIERAEKIRSSMKEPGG